MKKQLRICIMLIIFSLLSVALQAMAQSGPAISTSPHLTQAEDDSRLLMLTHEFPRSLGAIRIQTPSGIETVLLLGPATVQAATDITGMASDTDGDNLDQIATELLQLELRGYSSVGPVRVRLDSASPSSGEIEEQVNNTLGVLDVSPFVINGTADSFFDVFYEIEAGSASQSQFFYPETPIHIESVISGFPPAPREIYKNAAADPPVELLTAGGQPTGFQLVRAFHVFDPPIRVVLARHVTAEITINIPQQSRKTTAPTMETISLSGFVVAHVYIDRLGTAEDADGNGLDQAPMELVELELRGNSSLGPLLVRLRSDLPSSGEIEEMINMTPGVLDVSPFVEGGKVVNFFDIFFEIDIESAQASRQFQQGILLHTDEPVRVVTADQGFMSAGSYQSASTTPIELLDENGDPSGYLLEGVENMMIPLEIFLPTILRGS